MKTVLEKFDHSPLWIRLGVLSFLFGILNKAVNYKQLTQQTTAHKFINPW